ncbi:MAG TPA: hypothetical protein VNV66_18730 [Pilimelia sp.]|nr:hypothetical protein [Pilimelia sp.]
MSYPPQQPEESYPSPYQAGATPAPYPPAPGGYGATAQYPAAGYPAAGQGAEAPGYDPSYQPGYGPGYAAAPPASGVPGQQFSGPPSSGPPAGPTAMYGAPPPAAQGRGRVLTILLSAATAVFLVATVVLAVLFAGKSGDLEETRKDRAAQIAQRDGTIADRDAEIGSLKKDVNNARTELEETRQKLTGTQNDRDKIEREKQVVGRCLQLFADSMDAALKGDRARVNRLSGDLKKTCDEAEKYL